MGRQKELKLAMVVGCILTSSNAWAADITGNSSSGSASLNNSTQNNGGVYGWKYDDTSAATGGSVTLTNADVSYSSGSSASPKGVFGGYAANAAAQIILSVSQVLLQAAAMLCQLQHLWRLCRDRRGRRQYCNAYKC